MMSNFNIWQFFGGLGLFLYAMHQVENSLSSLGSKSFKNFLIRHTDRPIKSVISGGITTAMLQSSSLVGLLVLAFTGAGLISLSNALGVIFGSNLGTTLTGWIVATIGFKLDLDALSLPIIAFGSLLAVMTKGRKQQIGLIFAAIGLLLLGLDFMKDSVGGLKDQFDINRLQGFHSWQFLIFGAVFAAIVQSSSATMIIALAALDGGIISLPSAAAVAIGADLGTTSTIVIGATNGIPNKKRVAAAHVIFNTVTDLIAFILLIPLLKLIGMIGISNPLYSLVAFHTLFNLLGIILFLPFINQLAAFLEKLFVEKKVVLSHYLNQITPEVSAVALIAIRKETSHLIQRVLYQNRKGFQPSLSEPQGFLPLHETLDLGSNSTKNFKQLYHASKLLEGEILLFATDLQAQSLKANESHELNELLSAVRNAMHASKNINDIQYDLNEFEISNKNAVVDFIKQARSIMNDFFVALYNLKTDDNDQVSLEELQDLNTQVRAWHDQIHSSIFAAVHKREIADTEGSSMLNVNREILNSNQALINALRDYHQVQALVSL